MLAVDMGPLLSLGAGELSTSAAQDVFPMSTLAMLSEDVTPQASTAPGGKSPAQLRHAYGFDQIFFEGGTVAGDGSGQTIAIVNAYHTPTALNDLTQFSNFYGLARPT